MDFPGSRKLNFTIKALTTLQNGAEGTRHFLEEGKVSGLSILVGNTTPSLNRTASSSISHLIGNSI